MVRDGFRCAPEMWPMERIMNITVSPAQAAFPIRVSTPLYLLFTIGPAVAAGNYKHIWIYLVAPTLGALAGAGVYTLVKLRDEEAEPPLVGLINQHKMSLICESSLLNFYKI